MTVSSDAEPSSSSDMNDRQPPQVTVRDPTPATRDAPAIDISITAWHRRASLGSDYSTSSGESGADATTSTSSGETAYGNANVGGETVEFANHEIPAIQTRPDRLPVTVEPRNRSSGSEMCTDKQRHFDDEHPFVGIVEDADKTMQYDPSIGTIEPETKEKCVPNATRRRSREFPEVDRSTCPAPLTSCVPELIPPRHDDADNVDSVHRLQHQPRQRSSLTCVVPCHIQQQASLTATVRNTAIPRRSDEDESASDVSYEDEVDSYDDCDELCPLCDKVSNDYKKCKNVVFQLGSNIE